MSKNTEQNKNLSDNRRVGIQNSRNNHSSSAVIDILRLILSMLLLVLACAVFIFSFTYIKKNLSKEDIKEETVIKTEDTEQVQEIHLDKAPEAGIFKDSDGNIHYLLTNSEIQYYESDQIMQSGSMKLLRNTWIIRDGNVYFIDNNGNAAVGEYSERAMRYEFNKEGILTAMRYNTNYVPESTDTDLEYPGLVRGKMLWTFLDRYNSINGFYAVMYKGTTDSLSEYLGGTANKQYSLPFAVTVDGKNIYYLAYTENPTEEQEDINGKIYRMRPGENVRDLFADDAECYKLIKDQEKTVIVYSSNGKLYFSEGPIMSDEMPLFDENATYIVKIEDDKAYLSTEDGDIVIITGGEFHTGSFDYELDEFGEIISVAESDGAVRGNYIYSSETGEIFNSSMSRIIRRNDTGVKEILSGSFPGTLNDYHYDSQSDEIFAVYKDLSGTNRIVKISPDGDVEYLTDTISGSNAKLISIEEDCVCISCKSAGEVKYMKLSRTSTIHLASSIEPIVDYSDSGEPVERSVESYDEAVSEGPGYSVVDNTVTETENSNTVPQAEYTGPGNVSTPGGTVINNNDGAMQSPGTSQSPSGDTYGVNTGIAPGGY